MAREPDADSRPISVAELMARARELDGAPGNGREGPGRRRRGGAGSVSFAELTGELPRLSDTPPNAARTADAPPPDAATGTPSAAPDSRVAPDEAPTVGPDEDRATFPRSDTPLPTRETGEFPRSEVPVVRAPEPRTRGSAWAPPEGADRPTHPSTRDISSGAIADRFAGTSPAADHDSAATGIIGRVAATTDASAPGAGSLDPGDLSHLSPQEREREFQRYRDFEDIDSRFEPATEKKKRRGPFGGRRDAAAPVDNSPAARAHADPDVVDLDKAQEGAYSAAAADRSRQTAPEREPQTHPDGVTEHGASAARQWSMLGVQVVIGLVVGVGLFFGFHELWKWNVYFALVLSVVVMFGMVTAVHVARRSQDLVSTLLALAVGLIVTIGPLVLLASGS